MRFEPTTFSLATRRSTTELCPLIKKTIIDRAFCIASNNKNLFIILNSSYLLKKY